MKLMDLIDLCFRNLTRRKVRTLLTVVGVVVGTCAIVVMISLGIGMKESQEQALSEMGDLKLIQVYNYNSGTKNILNDATIEKWKGLKGVVTATPIYESGDLNLLISVGNKDRYQMIPDIVGVYPDALEELGYQIKEGQFFSKTGAGKDVIPIVVGEQWGYAFEDIHASPQNRYIMEGDVDQNGNPKKPFVNVMKDKITLTLTSNQDETKKLKKKILVCGRLKKDNAKDYRTAQGVFMDINVLKKLKEEYRRFDNGKKEADKGYQMAYVKVEDIKYIEEVEKVIKEDGFDTSSMESIRKPMEQQAKQQQAVLGGLGAISLFVAAIGITNTMIMSIYERTREIGVMKALGCYVRDIRTIFLLEAGTIGFFGGVIGILLSYGLSFIINKFGFSLGGVGEMITEGVTSGGQTSIIPLWLVALALIFSTFIGLISGYYPANRAVKISALEAIRGD
ncbi:MAG: ABC transporter permease [Clostridiales bacterium]|nr:ABC transporter permease [Clostridiales bacterium]